MTRKNRFGIYLGAILITSIFNIFTLKSGILIMIAGVLGGIGALICIGVISEKE